MPDRTLLKIGDVIRLRCVPAGDVAQRERELAAGAEDAGSTANAIERIIRDDPVVTITRMDGNMPWFEREMTDADGTIVYHSIAVLEDDSWEMVGRASSH